MEVVGAPEVFQIQEVDLVVGDTLLMAVGLGLLAGDTQLVAGGSALWAVDDTLLVAVGLALWAVYDTLLVAVGLILVGTLPAAAGSLWAGGSLVVLPVDDALLVGAELEPGADPRMVEDYCNDREVVEPQLIDGMGAEVHNVYLGIISW